MEAECLGMCCQDFRGATDWPCGLGGLLGAPESSSGPLSVLSAAPSPEACPSTLTCVPALGKLAGTPRLCWQGSLWS